MAADAGPVTFPHFAFESPGRCLQRQLSEETVVRLSEETNDCRLAQSRRVAAKRRIVIFCRAKPAIMASLLEISLRPSAVDESQLAAAPVRR